MGGWTVGFDQGRVRVAYLVVGTGPAQWKARADGAAVAAATSRTSRSASRRAGCCCLWPLLLGCTILCLCSGMAGGGGGV